MYAQTDFAQDQQIRQRSRQALIVDDAITARAMVANFLKGFGYGEIHTAANGYEALALAEELGEALGEVDLVVVDRNMPMMNGLELIRALRAGVIPDQTRILMMTTETGMDKILEALSAGANEYVMKPFTKEMLADKLVILGVAD